MLRGQVVKTNDILVDELNVMFNLMCKYYNNIKFENFINDLKKKSQVIILKDEENNEIKGFSTLVLFDVVANDTPVKLLFSGDTIIDKEFWSSNDLMQVWIKNAMELKKNFSERFFWLLISKGYKTYKYLSSLYNNFYPRYNKQTPDFEQEIMDKFGFAFYPDNYDKNKGLIIMNKAKDYLKDEYSKIPENKLRNKDIEFFVKKNPEYYKGNELVCITEIAVENLNPAGRRILGI